MPPARRWDADRGPELFRQTTGGLLLQSRRPLPGLPPLRGDSVVDATPLDVFLQERPGQERPGGTVAGPWQRVLDGSVRDGAGRPLLVLDRRRDLFRFTYLDGTTFWLDADARRLWASWPASSSLESTTIYLTGPVLGLALRLRGHLPLHAASVGVAGGAVLFVGPPGAGKSTLAAAFALAGRRVLAEDTSVVRYVDDRPEVAPDSPRIRLWPESTPLLFGGPRELPPLTENWSKGRLDLAEHAVERRPLPLAAIYFLEGEAEKDGPAGASPVAGPEVVVRLAANLAVPAFPDRELRARELEMLSRVASRVPAFRWARPPGHGPDILVREVVERSAAAPRDGGA